MGVVHWIWDLSDAKGVPAYDARVEFPRPGGCCLITDAKVSIGDCIRLSYPSDWPKRAYVHWAGEGEFACTFVLKMTAAQMSSMPDTLRFQHLSADRSRAHSVPERPKPQLPQLRRPKVKLWPLTDEDF